MGRLKEAWLADVETEDLIAKALAWEEDQKFERNLVLYEQIKLCSELSDTLLLHSSVDHVRPRMANIIDRLQRELDHLAEIGRDILKI